MSTPREEEIRRMLEEDVYPDLKALAQRLPGDAPRLEAIITKLRVIEAKMAGEELDEDDRREFDTNLPE